MRILTIIVNYLEPVSYGLSFIFLFWIAVRTNKVKLKILTAYYFLACIIMIKAALDDNNIWLYSLLCLLTSTALCFFFYYSLDARLKKWAVITIYIFNVIYYLVVELAAENTVFDSGAYVLLSISVVAMVFMYMHQILNNIRIEPLSLNFDFWYVCSQLVYHVGAFAIFLSNRYLSLMVMKDNSMESRLLFSELWVVHCVLLFLSALIIGASVLWISYHSKSPSS